MTRIILLERLRAFTEEVTADLIMPTRLQKGDTGAELPPCKGLPDAPAGRHFCHQEGSLCAAPGHYSGRDQQPQGQRVTSSAKVRSICCVYNDDEQEGGLMLLNLRERAAALRCSGRS